MDDTPEFGRNNVKKKLIKIYKRKEGTRHMEEEEKKDILD